MVSSEVDLRVVNERRVRFVARKEAMEEARERQFDFSDANRGPRVSRFRPSTYFRTSSTTKAHLPIDHDELVPPN